MRGATYVSGNVVVSNDTRLVQDNVISPRTHQVEVKV